MAGNLSSLQLIAGEGLLQNQGLEVSGELTLTIDAYTNTSLIAPFLQTIANGVAGNVLSNATISSLETLASNACASLSDSVPSGYPSLAVSTNPPGFTGLLSTTANLYLGNGDISKFIQAINIAEAYAASTKDFLNSAVNSQTYLADTFTGMTDLITGDVTSITLYTVAFGNDLANLGRLIDLSNLDNLGSPLALIQNIIRLSGGLPPSLSARLVLVGIPAQVVINLNNPNTSVTDSIQKLMYEAMKTVTNEDGSLGEVLTLLGVTTQNITSMADLLDPYKLFPNSFANLTTVTAGGLVPIYVDNQGSVNSNLQTQLPEYVLKTTP